MRLILVGGFLGSGKTTLVIRLAQAALARGLGTAIVVNEAGEVGIDDQLLRQHGLQVRELAGGCICCTLTAELPATLQRLQAEAQPAVVILEPSGVAEPKSIRAALGWWRDGPPRTESVGCVVDPLRIELLFEVAEPLITSQVAAADWIAISKQDQASAAELAAAQRIAAGLNPAARRFALDGRAALPEDFVGLLLDGRRP